MDRGNLYGIDGIRGGYSQKKRTDNDRRTFNQRSGIGSDQRSGNGNNQRSGIGNDQRSGNGNDQRSEYLEQYLGKFQDLMSKGVGGSSGSNWEVPRGNKETRKEPSDGGGYNRGPRGNEKRSWKGLSSSTSSDRSSAKPYSNLPHLNQQNSFQTPIMVSPPSQNSLASSFSKSVSVWQSDSKQLKQTIQFNSNLQSSGFMSATPSMMPSMLPSPVPPPSLNRLPGQGVSSGRGYSNLPPSANDRSSQPEPIMARSFNTTIPPPSVPLQSLPSLTLPSDLGKPMPDGSGLWPYPAPDLNSLTFDPTTGLRFDAITGLHYDANSGYFYNYKLAIFLVYDVLKQTYVRAPVHTAGDQLHPSGIQSSGTTVPQMLLANQQTAGTLPSLMLQPQAQSISDMQKMTPNQWNSSVLSSPDKPGRSGGNTLSKNKPYERMGGDVSNNNKSGQWKNRNSGFSTSRDPMGNNMNQAQEKIRFNQPANSRQGTTAARNERKPFHQRSKSPEDRHMGQTSESSYQSKRQHFPFQEHHRGGTPDYNAEPEDIDELETRNVCGPGTGRGKSPVEERGRRREMERQRSSPDVRDNQNRGLHQRASPGAYTQRDTSRNQRSPSNWQHNNQRSFDQQNPHEDRRRDRQPESSQGRSSYQKSTFPNRDTNQAQGSSFEQQSKIDSGRIIRQKYEDMTANKDSYERNSSRERPHRSHDRANTSRDRASRSRERVSRHRRSQSNDFVLSKNSQVVNVWAVNDEKSVSGDRKQPGEDFRQIARRNEEMLENTRSTWATGKQKPQSHTSGQSYRGGSYEKMRDDHNQHSSNYNWEPEVDEQKDIEDFSEDVSALLHDRSSEIDEDTLHIDEAARGRSRSMHRPQNRSQERKQTGDKENRGQRQPLRVTGRNSHSRTRSPGAQRVTNRNRNQHNEADISRGVPRSRNSRSRERQDVSRRSPQRDVRRPRSPEPRRVPERAIHGTRKDAESRRPVSQRGNERSPIHGSNVRHRSPTKRVSRSNSPLSRLGDVRRKSNELPSQSWQERKNSHPSSRRLSPSDKLHEKRKLPDARNVSSRRGSPPGHSDRRMYNRTDKPRTPPKNSPSDRRENRVMKSPSNRRYPADSRSAIRSPPTRKSMSNRRQSPSSVRHDAHKFSPENTYEKHLRGGSNRDVFERNNSPTGGHRSHSRARSVEEFDSRIDTKSPDQEQFIHSGRSPSRDNQRDKSFPLAKSSMRSIDHQQEGNGGKTLKSDTGHRSRTPLKRQAERSVSQEAKKLKYEDVRRTPEPILKSDVIVLDSGDEAEEVPAVQEVAIPDEDAINDDAIIEEDHHLSPSQSVGNLSMNSDELNYSASSIGSEPFNEEDESWTVLDCVEGESGKESDGSVLQIDEKDDDFVDEEQGEQLSGSEDSEMREILGKERPKDRERKQKQNYVGFCEPVEGDTHTLAPFFEPNPTKFIAATYRYTNVPIPFKFVKNLLVKECEDLSPDINVIPCKRDVNAAPYDFVTIIFPNVELANKWYSRYNGKIVTQYRRKTLELFLYFHNGNWQCDYCYVNNFPLRSICYACFKPKEEGGYSPVEMSNKPSRFIAIYKLSPIRPKLVVKPFVGLFKRNPYKRLHMISDPTTGHFSGICVIEMPNRLKGEALFKRLPSQYKKTARCAYVNMVDPDKYDGNQSSSDRNQPSSSKTHSSHKMPFKHFKKMSERAQLPKHRVPKPDGRGLLIYPPPDDTKFIFEPITQMYYDEFTGLYYHANSNLFYNDDLHICLRWDPDHSSYLYIDTAQED